MITPIEKIVASIAAEEIIGSTAFMDTFCESCPYNECPCELNPFETDCWKHLVIEDMEKEIAQCIKIAMHL